MNIPDDTYKKLIIFMEEIREYPDAPTQIKQLAFDLEMSLRESDVILGHNAPRYLAPMYALMTPDQKDMYNGINWFTGLGPRGAGRTFVHACAIIEQSLKFNTTIRLTDHDSIPSNVCANKDIARRLLQEIHKVIQKAKLPVVIKAEDSQHGMYVKIEYDHGLEERIIMRNKPFPKI